MSHELLEKLHAHVYIRSISRDGSEISRRPSACAGASEKEKKGRAIKNSAIFPFHVDEKLLPSDKYAMSEFALSDYSWQMNLTVNSLEKRDFGGYVCSSVNALGRADGVVRLQGTSRCVIVKRISLDLSFFSPCDRLFLTGRMGNNGGIVCPI